MSENTFDTEEVNLQIQPLPGYIDADGAFKLNTPLLSSFNFDGSIPKFDGQINAGDVEPGYLIQIESGGQYFPVVSIEKEEADLEDSPSGIISIGYIDSQGATVSVEYEETDQVSVVYEDWANKVLGSQGWGITAGGNAIFTNIAARGRIEAEEGYISGTLTIGSGGTTTVNDLTTAEDLDGFVTDTDLITNGATVINGNNITTGVIQANLIDITTNALPNRGVKLTALGLEGFDGSGNRTFYLNTNGSLDITGYATDGELSGGLSGKINNGGAATDVNNNVTNISGGKIRTGIIESNSYSGVTDGSDFSSNGLSINLTTGALTAEAFRVDTNGNASFRGNLQALSGYFGDPTYGITIGNNGSQVGLETTTLKFGSQNVSGYKFGAINFYTQEGLSLGSLSATNGSKVWFSSFGNGLGWGTSSDYILLPSSDNTTVRARFVGNGFNWYNADGSTLIMSIAAGGGGLRVQNNTGGVQVTGGGNITVSDGGRFVGDGSGLTNLPGGAGGGVTELKFGDNQLWRSGRVYISSGSVISAIDPGAIGNGKLANSTIQIMSTIKSLGQSFVAGDIDGDVITANTLPPGKISNSANLFSIGGTGVARGNAVANISGPLTIGNLTVSTSLDYVTNLGTSPVNLNRAANPMTLNGVRTASATIANTLRNLPQIEGLSGNGIIVHGLGGLLAGLNYTATEANRYLQVNSTGTSLQWTAFSGLTNPMTGGGDMIYGGTGGAATRLAAGTSGQILQSNGTSAPTWTSSIPSLTVSNARGLNYTMNMGNSAVNLNRAAGTMTLSGVTVDGLSLNTALFTLGTTAITAGNTFSTISGGITLNGGPILGGGPTLQTGTNGFVTVTIGSGGTFRINTLPLNLSGATSFVRYNPSTGAVAYTTTTSALKYKNIVEQGVDLSDDSWLDNINIVKFKYKLEEEKFLEDAPVRIGLIADEISNLPIFNEIVERDSVTGEVDSIQYDKLALYLIPVIKELKNKVNSLEERLEAAGL